MHTGQASHGMMGFTARSESDSGRAEITTRVSSLAPAAVAVVAGRIIPHRRAAVLEVVAGVAALVHHALAERAARAEHGRVRRGAALGDCGHACAIHVGTAALLWYPYRAGRARSHVNAYGLRLLVPRTCAWHRRHKHDQAGCTHMCRVLEDGVHHLLEHGLQPLARRPSEGTKHVVVDVGAARSLVSHASGSGCGCGKTVFVPR